MTVTAGALLAGTAVMLTVAAVSDSLSLRFGSSDEAIADQQPPGSLVYPGDRRVQWIQHEVVSPIATDGSTAYYAVLDSDGWEAVAFDPSTAEERALGRVGEIDGILKVARVDDGTLFAGSTTVVLVRDSGVREAATLPPLVREAGLGAPPFVEAVAASGATAYVARFNDRDIIELTTEPALSVVRVHELPDGVSPPKELRVTNDGRLFMATAVASERFGPGAWILDLRTGVANGLDGFEAPDALSPTGQLVLRDSGAIVRVEDDGPADSGRAALAGAMLLAADPAGAVWTYNAHLPDVVVRHDTGGSSEYGLPRFLVYRGGPSQPGGAAEQTAEEAAIGVSSMIALDNGDLVFAATYPGWIGLIRSPR